MSFVIKFKDFAESKVPGVFHFDKTGRLQTVTNENNPWFYHFLTIWNKESGVPILLNTSFNENEPVVCTPEEALETFLRTKMDLLVIGDWLIKRKV